MNVMSCKYIKEHMSESGNMPLMEPMNTNYDQVYNSLYQSTQSTSNLRGNG